MAINYPGPYELRVFYTPTGLTAPVLQHTLRLNIDLVAPASQGDLFANYDIKDKDGTTTIALSTVVEDFLTVFNELYTVANVIDGVELWKYPTAQTFDAIFWSSYTPTANVGTRTGTVQPASQEMYVFRTQEGGIMKTSPMEGLAVPGVPLAYAAMTTQQKAMVDYVLDGDGATYTAPFLGRDTSYPFSFKQMFPGQNEALWKRRNGRS